MANRRWKLGRTEHEIVSEQLSSYMDRQLAALARAQVERHLATCAECREELRSMQWTRQLLQQAPVARVPRSFVIREADVARARPATMRSPVLALRWASSVVALLLVLVFAGDFLTSGLMMGARLASAPASYGETVERQAVEEEKAVAAPEGTPSVVADEVQVAGAPSPTAAPAAKMVAQEKRVEATSAAAAPAGAEVAPAETPPPLMVAPEATQSAAQTPTPAAEALAVQSTGLPSEKDATAAADVEQEAVATTEPAPTEFPGPVTLRGHEEGPAVRTGPRRVGWRVAEIGLGAVLLALVIAAIWARLRR